MAKSTISTGPCSIVFCMFTRPGNPCEIFWKSREMPLNPMKSTKDLDRDGRFRRQQRGDRGGRHQSWPEQNVELGIFLEHNNGF